MRTLADSERRREIGISFREFMRFASSRPDRRGPVVVVKAYLDDSGGKTDAAVVIAGCLAHSDTWDEIEREWIAIEAAYRTGPIHWKDLRKPGARFERCSEIEIDLFAENLAHAVFAHKRILHLGSCMFVSDYQMFADNVPGFREATKKDPRIFCQEHVFQQTITYAKDIFPGEELIVMMDVPSDELAHRSDQINRAYSSGFWGKAVSSITFGRRESYAPLRAVDFVANQTFKHFRDVVVAKRPERQPVLTRAMSRYMDRRRSGSVASFYDLEALTQLSQNILAGKTIFEVPEPRLMPRD